LHDGQVNWSPPKYGGDLKLPQHLVRRHHTKKNHPYTVDFLGSTSCSHLEKYFCQWMSIPGGQQDRRKKNTMLELILAENFTVLGGRMD
jgi:hypothetical protein